MCDFRLICHATDSAIEAYRCGVWRDRYAKRYDMPEKKGGREIMMLYKVRSKLLRKGARFLMGLQPREVRCLKVLRDLVVGEWVAVIIDAHNDIQRSRYAVHRFVLFFSGK